MTASHVLAGRVRGVHIGRGLPVTCKAFLEGVGDVETLSPPGTDGIDRDTARWALMNSKARDEGAWLVGTRNKTEGGLL